MLQNIYTIQIQNIYKLLHNIKLFKYVQNSTKYKIYTKQEQEEQSKYKHPAKYYQIYKNIKTQKYNNVNIYEVYKNTTKYINIYIPK